MEDKKKKNVELEIGTKLQIGIKGVTVPITSTLVGMSVNEYIIIKPPSPLSAIKFKLDSNVELVIKFLSEGKIIAFKTKIISFIAQPDKLFFLGFPDKFVHHDLRGIERKMCAIPAKTVISGIEKDGVITDISSKGCGFIISYTKSETKLSIEKDGIIALRCLLPGIEGEQNIFCIIKNIKKHNWEIIIGTQFVDLSEDLQDKINQFIQAVK